MRITNLLKVFLMLLVFSFFAACSDDDDGNGPNEPDNGDDPPELNVQQITVPQKMQTAANGGDPGAAQAVSYIQLANMLPSYAQLLNPPADAGKVPSISATAGEWTWTQGGATFTLTSTESGNTYSMTLTVDGSYQGETYNGQIIMEASGQLDGSQGQLKFYEPGTSAPVLIFNWETLADNTYHVTIDSNQGSSSANIELYSYPDGSGSLDINTQGAGSWDIDWNADGSGTWAQYDASGGLANQGSWG